jgi:RNA polymerase sigma-70 factor (ECF subfamily)
MELAGCEKQPTLKISERIQTSMFSEVIPVGAPQLNALDRPATIAPGHESVFSMVDDRMLIEHAQAGDAAAFEALVGRYDRQVLRLSLNVLGGAEDARDVYQESFLKIYRNLHRFRFECSFYTWIYRIVTNVCLDHLRRRRSRPEDQPPVVRPACSGESCGADFFDHVEGTGAQSNPERHLLGQEIGSKIEAALETLSPRERMVFEMKHYHGMRLRTIGEALGTTEETVKNSLFRATRKMRTHLEGLR